jgi:hypothetical protein
MHMASLQQAGVKALVTCAVRGHFALAQERAWVADFMAELVCSQLYIERNAELDGEDDPAAFVELDLSAVPADVEEAEALWGSILVEQLDGAEPEDVRGFCAQVLAGIRELAEGGVSEEEDGEEGACEMCERVMPLTKHHLIPR